MRRRTDTRLYPALLVNLGAAIAAARKRAGLTQARLAAAVDLSRTAVANIEAGRNDTSLCRLALIAAAVGVPASELLRRAEGTRETPPEAEARWRRTGLIRGAEG